MNHIPNLLQLHLISRTLRQGDLRHIGPLLQGPREETHPRVHRALGVVHEPIEQPEEPIELWARQSAADTTEIEIKEHSSSET